MLSLIASRTINYSAYKHFTSCNNIISESQSIPEAVEQKKFHINIPLLVTKSDLFTEELVWA